MKEANLAFTKVQDLFETSLFQGFVAKQNQDGESFLVIARKALSSAKDTSLVEGVIRYLKNSSHKFLLKLKNAFWEENILYFVFENFPGTTLAQVARSLSLEQKIRIFNQIVNFLSQIHEERRVFLGLNPQTILIDPTLTQCKFFDFSHSFSLGDCSSLSFSEEYLGFHSFYLAPEQTGLLNKTPSLQTDLYMLGAVAYELFASQPLFQAEDLSKMLHLHLAAKPVSLKRHNRDIPDSLDKLILRLLKKDPSKRFPHAMALFTELKKINLNYDRIISPSDYSLEDTLCFPADVIAQEPEWSDFYHSAFHAASSFFAVLKGKSGTGKTFLMEGLARDFRANGDIVVYIKPQAKFENTPFALTSVYFDDKTLLDELEDFADSIKQQALGEPGNLLFPGFAKVFRKNVLSAMHRLLFSAMEPSKEQRLLQILDFYGVMAGILERHFVFLLDDLSRVDKNSLRYLCRFYEQNEKLRGLKFIFSRAEEEHRERLYDFFPSTFRELHLKPWQVKDIEYFLKQSFDGGLEISKKKCEWFLHNTLGNPLAVKETLKFLLRSNLIYFYKNTWYLDEDKISSIAVLPDVSRLFGQYLSVFDEGEKYYLALAALLGRRFTFKEIRDLTLRYENFKDTSWGECVSYFFGSLEQASNLGISENFLPGNFIEMEVKQRIEGELCAVLQKACKYQLLSWEETSYEDYYFFSHRYFYENLERFIPQLSKNKLHALKARMLMEYYHENQDEGIYQVVFHYNQIESDSKLFYYQKLYYNNLAYQKALADRSTDKAIYYLREIVDYSLRVGFMDQFIIRLQLKLSQYLILQAQFSKAQEYLELALKSAQENRWSNEEQQVYLQNASVNYYLKKPDATLELYQKVMNLAREKDLPLESSMALTYIGATYFFSSEFEKASGYFNEAVKIAKPHKSLDMIFSHGMLGWQYLWQGQLKKAFLQLKILKQQIGVEEDSIILSSYYHICAVIYALSGVNLNKALHYSYLASWHARKAESPLFEYSAYASRMWAFFFQGDEIKALRAIHKAQEIGRSHQIWVGFSYFQACQCEIYFRRGDYSQAYQMALEELDKPAHQEDKSVAMIYLKIIAAYHILRSEDDLASASLEKGLTLYRETGLGLFGVPLLFLKRFFLAGREAGEELLALEAEIRELSLSHEGIELIFERSRSLEEILKENVLDQGQPSVFSPINSFKEKMQLKNIMRLSDHLSRTKNIHELLQVMLKKFIEMTGAQRGALILVNQVVPGHGFKFVQNIELLSDDFEIPARIIEEVKSTRLGLTYTSSYPHSHPGLSDAGICSLLCEPLLYGAEVLGIIYLDHLELKNLFSEEDQQLLRIFTLQAAVAVKNASLVRQIGVPTLELSPGDQKKISLRHDLTKREMEVLLLLLKGQSNRQISEQSFISMSTVKTHISHIYEKMRIQNREQLVKLCQEVKQG